MLSRNKKNLQKKFVKPFFKKKIYEKNILFIIMILLVIAKTSSGQVEKLKFTWTFHFDIASYSHDCNSGLGLCFIPPKFNLRTVEAGIVKEGRTIQIHINRNTLPESLERELLRLTQFPIAEGTILPMEIANKLGIRTEVELIPGYYPLLVEEEYIIIKCQIE